jgi:predicted  nucleic acid-binding Zn-ribbon protein
VSIHDVTRAWKGDEVVQCHSCARILYAATL